MKQLYLLIFFLSINCFSQNEFITVWKTNNVQPNNSITIPITENTSPYTYVWENLDDDYNVISSSPTSTTIPANNDPITITFATPGIYRIKISTNSSSFRFNNNGNQLGKDLIKVEQWGNINWTSMESSFEGCSNLNITATDIPNLSNIISMSAMFKDCTNLIFNESINNWLVDTVIDFSYLFYNAALFNQPINKWDTSNATNLSFMFQSANNFNQPIGNWEVHNVENFDSMFHFNTAFNQALTYWQTNNAQNMNHMFCGTSKFNQDINHFNVSRVISFNAIFDNSIRFNQDLSNWQLNSAVQVSNFFNYSGIDCYNFTNTILSWSRNPNLKPYLNIGVDQMKHTEELTPILRWLETNKNWTFTGELTEYENCTLSNIDFQTTTLNIYPNPTSSFINIEGLEVEKVAIYDVKGSLVQKTLNNNQVDISHLSSGNYILIINDQYKENIIKR